MAETLQINVKQAISRLKRLHSTWIKGPILLCKGGTRLALLTEIHETAGRHVIGRHPALTALKVAEMTAKCDFLAAPYFLSAHEPQAIPGMCCHAVSCTSRVVSVCTNHPPYTNAG